MANKQNSSMDLENKNQVVITPEDSNECAKFFEFFEIAVPEELSAAFKAFSADPTFANQNELKFQLAHIISFSDHAVFNDKVFEAVRPETREICEELTFERELEKQLTS